MVMSKMIVRSVTPHNNPNERPVETTNFKRQDRSVIDGKKYAELGTAVGAMSVAGTLGGNFLGSQSFPTVFVIHPPQIALFWFV